MDEDAPKRGALGGSFGGILGMGGASVDGKVERRPTMGGGGGGLPKDGEEGLGKDTEDGQPPGSEEGQGLMSQVTKEQQTRKSFDQNPRESIEGRQGRDFSGPNSFLAMPSAPSAQVSL